MNRKIISILFIVSTLLLSTTACCLSVKTSETVTEITQKPEEIKFTTVPSTTMPETIIPETIKGSYFDNIDERIKYKVEEGMFPESWYKEPIDARAIGLNPNKIEKVTKIAVKALKKYPEDFLLEYLNRIYFLDFLNFY